MAPIEPRRFVSELRNLRFPRTFNPYGQHCEKYDKTGAPEIRARVLRRILSATTEVDIDAIWVGRDLGHRGGRRTGLALTDDVRFCAHTRRWGVETERPTRGPMVSERTASVVWDMLGQIDEYVFLWNVFPLHPFPDGSIFRNRAHSAVERDVGMALLKMLVSLLRPRRIVAVGNDAALALRSLCKTLDINHVRHPSCGGENLFREQVASLYGFRWASPTTKLSALMKPGRRVEKQLQVQANRRAGTGP